MDPLTFGLISAGITTLGAGLSSGSSFMNYSNQKRADSKSYKRQVALLKMQQDWQEKMANTAHQREVKDLRAAGLNPILSAGGAGSATPSVSAPSVSTGSNQDFFDSSDPASSFMNGVATYSNVALNEASAKKANADSALADAMVATEQAKQEEIKARTADINAGLPNKILKNLPASELRRKGLTKNPYDKAVDAVGKSLTPLFMPSSAKERNIAKPKVYKSVSDVPKSSKPLSKGPFKPYRSPSTSNRKGDIL